MNKLRERAHAIESGLRIVDPAASGSTGVQLTGSANADTADLRLKDRSPIRMVLRRRAMVFSLLLFVIFPTAATSVYMFGFASDQYVSELRLSIRTADPRMGDATPVFQGMASASQIGLDSYVLTQFIQSREFVDKLQQQVSLSTIYARSDIDFLARLRRDASAEQVVRYWRGMVDPFFDLTQGAIVIRVKAFTPVDAQRLAQQVYAISDQLIANLTARVRRETLSVAEAELARAELRLKNALKAKEAFRIREGTMDPTMIAAGVGEAAARLRVDLAMSRAQLAAQMQDKLGDSSPTVRELRKKIIGLEQELALLETKSSSLRTLEASLAQAASSYEELNTDQRIAENALGSALASMEAARATAGRQGSYLLAFVNPSLPQEALYPQRARNVLIALLASVTLWAIGWLLVAAVREHF